MNLHDRRFGPEIRTGDSDRRFRLEVLHLYISEGHNFVGHHGGPPEAHEAIEVGEIQCIAGRGIEGDRYFGHEDDFKGQITFFADEVVQDLRARFSVRECAPSVFRRNVITRGLELNELIGREFEIQGVRFFGTEECRPCYWMDEALAPGAEQALPLGLTGLTGHLTEFWVIGRGKFAA